MRRDFYSKGLSQGDKGFLQQGKCCEQKAWEHRLGQTGCLGQRGVDKAERIGCRDRMKRERQQIREHFTWGQPVPGIGSAVCCSGRWRPNAEGPGEKLTHTLFWSISEDKQFSSFLYEEKNGSLKVLCVAHHGQTRGHLCVSSASYREQWFFAVSRFPEHKQVCGGVLDLQIKSPLSRLSKVSLASGRWAAASSHIAVLSCLPSPHPQFH